MTVWKYSFLLTNSSHKYIWELYVLAKYGNFVLNIQNFEKTPQTFLNEYQKSNWFLKKKVICQNSSQTVLTPAIIWELFAKKSADRPNCHYSSVTFSNLLARRKSNLKVWHLGFWPPPKNRGFGCFPIFSGGCQTPKC